MRSSSFDCEANKMNKNYYSDLKFEDSDVDAGPFEGVVDYVNTHRDEISELIRKGIEEKNAYYSKLSGHTRL